MVEKILEEVQGSEVENCEVLSVLCDKTNDVQQRKEEARRKRRKKKRTGSSLVSSCFQVCFANAMRSRGSEVPPIPSLNEFLLSAH
uniref:Uncharacterized protein n=1 Tax=Timema shepardi TaxID=629360 RepID=A0A7R9G0M4_TIMSH|nr:unnamed protein product [Timema shepardi]